MKYLHSHLQGLFCFLPFTTVTLHLARRFLRTIIKVAYPSVDRLASRARFVLPQLPLSPSNFFSRVMTSLVLTTLADVEPQVPPVAPGLRKVPPYWYPYSTYAKERWIGREILEVVSTEFRDRSMEYYVRRLTLIFLFFCSCMRHRDMR